MSHAYLEVVERFINLQELLIEDDKNRRKKPKKVPRKLLCFDGETIQPLFFGQHFWSACGLSLKILKL